MTRDEYRLHPITAFEVVKNEIIATTGQMTNQRRKKFPISSDQARHAWVNIMDTASIRTFLQKTPRTTIPYDNPTLQSKCSESQISLRQRRRVGRVDNTRAFRFTSRSPAPRVRANTRQKWSDLCVKRGWQKRPNGIRRRARLASREWRARRGGCDARHSQVIASRLHR